MLMRHASSVMVLALLGCTGGGGTGPVELPPNATANGFVCTTTPSEAYGPGYVYRVDPEGNDSFVDLLTEKIETHAFRMADRTATAKVTRGGGLKLALTGPFGPFASASADATASSGSDSLVSFKGSQMLLMTDRAAKDLEALAKSELSPVPENSYYVVRDVVQAKTISIVLSSEDTRALGGSAKVKGVVELSPNVSFEDSQSVTVEGTYDPPMNVCVRAVLLEPILSDEPNVVSGGTSWRVTDQVAAASGVARMLGGR